MKPRLLDLYCCAGGAAKGYQRAGFHVTGVDINPQPNYCGDEFVQMNALEYVTKHSRGYVAVHASPPCQTYSQMSNCRPGLADEYPDLVGLTRQALDALGLPYVIENVPGAPLAGEPDLFGTYGVTLCGSMFGLKLYRHRLFEASLPIPAPNHPAHLIPASKAGHWEPGTVISVSGNCSPIAVAKAAMGIDWMNRAELAEAIPPAYTEYIGGFLMAEVLEAAA